MFDFSTRLPKVYKPMFLVSCHFAISDISQPTLSSTSSLLHRSLACSGSLLSTSLTATMTTATSSIFLGSIATSFGLFMILGGFSRRLWARNSWGGPSEAEVWTTVFISTGYLVAIAIAVDHAIHHHVLRVFLPGCFTAGVLAGSAGLAYGIAFPGRASQAKLCRRISFGMAAVYVGILFELKTREFTHWILWVDADLD